jgi:amino acid adenylation domain-containing protein/FkbM family methyltransferase
MMCIDIRDDSTIVTEFERRAAEYADNVAVVYNRDKWTYAQLNARVQQIAIYLAQRGVGPGIYIGTYLQPSPYLIATLLAILRTGAAYVPVDRGSPRGRLSFLISDANLQFVVTDDADLKEPQFLQLTEISRSEHSAQQSRMRFPAVRAGSDAYVIYTSGSSGQPKGVICTHHNVLRLFTATRQQFSFSEKDRWTLFHSIAFDFSVWELFGALLYGGTLVVVPPDIARDTVGFASLLLSSGITILNLTPSAFFNLLNVAESRSQHCLASLRLLILGGERLDVSKLRRWFALSDIGLPRLINMYGITETTVHVTFKEMLPPDVNSSDHLSPIGVPIADMTVYLLDEQLKPVPDGSTGEICVAGAGLARGYLNRPQLTEQRFIPNPFDASGDTFLYRSGDLGRRSLAGDLYYLGRSDRQVKIRGYRIELGEIEEVLGSLPGVALAHVTASASESDETKLLAYVVPDAKEWPGAFIEADALARGAIRLMSIDNELVVAYVNRAETLFMYDEIFKIRLYERLGVHFADGACIVDVGANIGLFSLFSMTRCRAPRLVAIEPLPICAEALRINLERYSADFRVHRSAMSDVRGTSQLRYYHRATVMSGRYASGEEAVAMKTYLANKYGAAAIAETLGETGLQELVDAELEYTELPCELDTLSSLFEREHLSDIDILKIDVEKSELDVLRGIEDKHWPNIKQIVMEVHDIDDRLKQILTLLESRGFMCRTDYDELLSGTALCNVYGYRAHLENSLQRATESTPRLSLKPQSILFTEYVRSSLSERLPSYMNPSHLQLLAELPLTVNGKADERKLAAMVPNQDRARTRPADMIESRVEGICLDVLKIREIDLETPLVESGAHSLAVVMIAMRLQDAFNVDVPVRQLQDNMSIASIATRIRAASLPGHDRQAVRDH